MKDGISLLFRLLTTLAKLLRPGGGRAIIAANLLLKQQLIIHSRSRQRAPNLTTQDRVLLGFWSLFQHWRDKPRWRSPAISSSATAMDGRRSLLRVSAAPTFTDRTVRQ